MQPPHLPPHELFPAFAGRHLSPVQLPDDCFSRIDRLEPRLQAFVSVDRANARHAAEAAEKAIHAAH